MFTPFPRSYRWLAAVLLGGALLALPAAGATAAPAATLDSASGSGALVHHDVAFVAMMVPHHQNAVDMASVAEQGATTAEVRALATRIRQSQADEITRMLAWLAGCHTPPIPSPPAVQAMQDQDMMMLRQAEGIHVDMMFVMMMRPHHAQAVSAAEDELGNGGDAFALSLARSVFTSQSSEILEMNDLLTALHERNPGMM